MKKNTIFFLILITFLGALVTFIYFNFSKKPLEKEKIIKEEFSFENSQIQEIYQKAIEAEGKIKKDKMDYEAYLEAGLAWKSLGDQTQNKIFYQKSKEIYQKQTEVFPNFWVPWWNLANLEKNLGEYSEAKNSFKKAIEISPGEGMIYLGLIELYRYNFNKSESEIIAVYEEALKRVFENINVIVSYASYLYEIDKKEEALKYYQMVFEKYPETSHIKEEIEKIKKEIRGY